MICSIKEWDLAGLGTNIKAEGESGELAGEQAGAALHDESWQGLESWKGLMSNRAVSRFLTPAGERPDTNDEGDVIAERLKRQHDIKIRFGRLASRWREECRFTSSSTEIAMHPAYQQIIGMGRDALPLILEALEAETDHWFWALCAITGEDPVPPQTKGNLEEMANVWLRWARERQYV